ncbi:hypothetical protein U1Q18_031560 [Sarracenia purpurea var. burkii]
MASVHSHPATQRPQFSTSTPSPLIAPNPRSHASSEALKLLGATQSMTGGGWVSRIGMDLRISSRVPFRISAPNPHLVPSEALGRRRVWFPN